MSGNVIPFKLYEIGTTAFHTIIHLFTSGEYVLSLNIVDSNENLIISNTVTFAHVKEEEEDHPKLFHVKGMSHIGFYISEVAAKRFVLQNVHKTVNGFDHHFVFQYKM